MNSALEKILREFEQSRQFGSIEIIYNNGVPITVHIKRTLKMISTAPQTQREHRGASNGNQQSESR